MNSGERKKPQMITNENDKYLYKYHKYFTKYMNRIGSQKNAQVIRQELDRYLKILEQEPISVELVEQIADFFERAIRWNYDVEQMHLLEDRLMRNLIDNTANGKISIDQIRPIAIAIKKITDQDYLKWYS